jgi:hypothetical protein
MGLLVHHDDAVREYAYDRSSFESKLDKALDAAPAQGWTIVCMKNDWNRVFSCDTPVTSEIPAEHPELGQLDYKRETHLNYLA